VEGLAARNGELPASRGGGSTFIMKAQGSLRNGPLADVREGMARPARLTPTNSLRTHEPAERSPIPDLLAPAIRIPHSFQTETLFLILKWVRPSDWWQRHFSSFARGSLLAS
jgi:hypothetical protein